MSSFTFELRAEVDDTLREAVYRELRAFNRAANPLFWALREEPANRPAPLIILALDAQGAPAGGLFGETQLAWLKVSVLAVRTELRGQGIGTELLRRAEAEAARRGCRYAYLDTMSYQAPGFYERLGYRVVGQLDDWDSCGHTQYHLTKPLPEHAG